VKAKRSKGVAVQGMYTWRGMEACVCAFLTLPLDWVQEVKFTLRPLYGQENTTDTLFIGGCIAAVEVLEVEKSISCAGNRNTIPRSPNPYANHNTE
jgi:hypothetical protein